MAVHVKSRCGMPLCRLEVAIRCPQVCLFVEDWIKLQPKQQCYDCKVLMGLEPTRNTKRQKAKDEEDARPEGRRQ